jgi:CRP/FNR family cyclic AMP-dependent transcriptional regulator
MVPIELLRSFPYFAGVSSESLKAVAAVADERDFRSGEILFREGDPAHYLHIVRQGQVDIIYRLQGGAERVVDTVVGGELLGWSAVVEPYLSTATGVAREAGQVVRLPAARIRALCDQDPSLGYRLLMHVTRVLSDRLQGARVQLAAGS